MSGDGGTPNSLALACAVEQLAQRFDAWLEKQGSGAPPNNILAPQPVYFNSGTGGQVLTQRTTRRYLLVINLGAATIYMGLGQQCNSAQQGGIPIGVGGSYEMNQIVFTNMIYLSSGQALVLEA